MSLIQFLRIFWARRGIILIALVASLSAALLAGRVLPPRYTAQSRVLMDVVKPDPVTGEMISSAFARAYVKTQIELIRDYRIAGRATDLLGWADSPELAAQYRARDPNDTRDFRRWLAQRIMDGTSTQLVEGSNVLEISYSSSNPEIAAQVADAIRRAYVDQAIAFKREDAANNARWFRGQADEIRGRLTQAELRLSNFERTNGIVLDQDLIDQESKRLAALSAATPMPTMNMPAVAPANPMAGQIAEANAAIAAAEKSLGPNNPQLIDLRRRRDALIAAGAAATPRVSGGSSGPSLQALVGSQQAKVLAQRGLVDEARRFASDVAVLREQYQKTSARAVDLEQQAQALDSGLTLLGSATTPTQPTFPNWPLLIFGSAALGLVMGVLVALLAELTARRVRGVEDMRFANVPVLGTMSGASDTGGERPTWRKILGDIRILPLKSAGRA
jgi:uncharacterized protein involved in exopolysaccharide biosynthesis